MSFIRPIIEDAKVFMSRITKVTVAQVHRQANDLAHCLAKFALHDSISRSWFEEPPDLLGDHCVVH
ncbi:hypothetical protein D8674_000480 [Pyrus ussuriensis x Pyrus communis]|uniref:RNase H type-1 domain-containing protein n=1 Tax=Pyrus ussuriensis x Pyrus communis TaxID=2448454 RepID=A0A5N5F8Y8_9ROSA|nr:hypothetical protein D8674_000480 [Pyrus ussuriensis x Pyrus communis]